VPARPALMFAFDDGVLEEIDQGDPSGPPYLVCWYSGGYKKDEGRRLLVPFLESAKRVGIKDHLVLDHNNEYGMTEEGYEPYPRYVDLLVEKIDEVAAGRPLLLFAHSRGCCPAAAVATRLGCRVLKVYFVASQGAVVPGKPTPWEKLSKRFRRNGERSMLSWFSELQPGNLLLDSAAHASQEDRDEMKETSKFLANMITLMNTQYRDAMYPDMSKGVIDTFPADICAIAPSKDTMCTVEACEGFHQLTSGRCDIWLIVGGHMEVLKPDTGSTTCELHDRVLADMLAIYENEELRAWTSDLRQLKQEQLFGRLPCTVNDASFDKELVKAHQWVAENPYATREDIAKQHATIYELIAEF